MAWWQVLGKRPYFDDREIYREFDYHRDEMKKYEKQLDRFKRANDYLKERAYLRDIDRDGNPQDQEQFSDNPSGWFKGKKH